MSSATADAISCPTCGKKYSGKPEFAGKQVRCKCGTVIAVPPSIPPPPMPGQQIHSTNDQPPAMAPLAPVIRPAAELDSDDLYDLVAEKTPAPVRTVAASTPKKTTMPVIVPGLDDDATCPSCDRPMQPGTILCAHCGFNLKTGEKPQRPAASSTKSAAVAFAALSKPTKSPVDEHKKLEIAKVLFPLVAIFVVLGLGVAAYNLAIKSYKSTAAAKGSDAQVIEWLSDPGGKEIHEWFKQDPDRMAGGYSSRQAIAKADELQALGARQVLAFGARMTRALAVELPDDPDKRKALFDWESKYALDHFYKPDKDVGQRYLILNLGI